MRRNGKYTTTQMYMHKTQDDVCMIICRCTKLGICWYSQFLIVKHKPLCLVNHTPTLLCYISTYLLIVRSHFLLCSRAMGLLNQPRPEQIPYAEIFYIFLSSIRSILLVLYTSGKFWQKKVLATKPLPSTMASLDNILQLFWQDFGEIQNVDLVSKKMVRK